VTESAAGYAVSGASRQAPDQEPAAQGDDDLGDREREGRAPDALGPARREPSAQGDPKHERGEHERRHPDRVAEHAAERAEPQHLEQQRRGARS